MKRWDLFRVFCLMVCTISCANGSDQPSSRPARKPSTNAPSCTAGAWSDPDLRSELVWITSASPIGNRIHALICREEDHNSASASSYSRVTAPSPSLSFTVIPPITIFLGKKMEAIDLDQHVRGGKPPFTYSIASQTMPTAIECLLKGSDLSSDYAYRGGINKVTLRVTDSEGAHASTMINVKVAVPQVAYQVYGINFSPYENGQADKKGIEIGIDQITQRMGVVVAYTKWIRSFRSTYGQEYVGAIAHKFGVKACMGVSITDDQRANATEMSNLIAHARNGEADCAVIGSEAVFRKDATPDQLIRYIDQFRAAVPSVPVTTADVYESLLVNPKLVNDCDFIFVNYYPYWEGKDISGAIEYLNAEDALLRRMYPNKEVIVSETGWPSAGKNVGYGVSSQENAAGYFLNFESWARAGGRKSFYFEAFDEAWKFTPDMPQEARFGIFDQNGVMKYGKDVFSGRTVSDNWTCKAAPPGNNSAAIQLTFIPSLGDRNFLEGHASYVNPANYYVVVYVHDGWIGWWIKPYARLPRTFINCNGTWTANIVTGKKDAFADQIAAFLIPSAYNPPILQGARELPAELYNNAVTNVFVKSRTPRKVGIE